MATTIAKGPDIANGPVSTKNIHTSVHNCKPVERAALGEALRPFVLNYERGLQGHHTALDRFQFEARVCLGCGHVRRVSSDAVEGVFHEPRERRATLQLLVLRVVGWGCGWPAAALWHVVLVRRNEYFHEPF